MYVLWLEIILYIELVVQPTIQCSYSVILTIALTHPLSSISSSLRMVHLVNTLYRLVMPLPVT